MSQSFHDWAVSTSPSPSVPIYRTMHHHVVDVLGLELVAGVTQPGDTLEAEPLLCARLGVSRGALREAVKALAARGMVELRPRTGTRVLPRPEWNMLDARILSWMRQTDPDSLIIHLTEVRSLIEPGAAELAAMRALDAEREELLSAYEDMATASKNSHVAQFTLADIRFHHVLLRSSHNPLLAALNSSLEVALEVTFETTSKAPGAFEATLPLHQKIATAVASGAATDARQLMETLIGTSARHYSEVRHRSDSRN